MQSRKRSRSQARARRLGIISPVQSFVALFVLLSMARTDASTLTYQIERQDSLAEIEFFTHNTHNLVGYALTYSYDRNQVQPLSFDSSRTVLSDFGQHLDLFDSYEDKSEFSLTSALIPSPDGSYTEAFSGSGSLGSVRLRIYSSSPILKSEQLVLYHADSSVEAFNLDIQIPASETSLPGEKPTDPSSRSTRAEPSQTYVYNQPAGINPQQSSDESALASEVPIQQQREQRPTRLEQARNYLLLALMILVIVYLVLNIRNAGRAVRRDAALC